MQEQNQPEFYIGLMSGTSMDGIDAVLVNFSQNRIKLKHAILHPLPESLKIQLDSVISPHWRGSLSEIGTLNQQLGKLFADAVNSLLAATNINPHQVRAIGSHGQTVWHQPEGNFPFSIQLGDANQITEHTGITTVSDFRNRDIAANGQGAPLLPAFHNAILGKQNINRIILNIGGIANITIMGGGRDIIGFDTGPGNGLLDSWTQKNKQKAYDKDGEWAKSGHIQDSLLQQLLKDPYFSQATPKSTGKEYFNLDWLKKTANQPVNSFKPQDIQATLTELSAITIAQAIVSTIKKRPGNWDELFIYGGGLHNFFLLERLQHHLPGFNIESTEKLGIAPDWMEAIAFSWLARQTLNGMAGNLPSATGAIGPRVLGAIYHK